MVLLTTVASGVTLTASYSDFTQSGGGKQMFLVQEQL